jgi:ATP-dependent Clp protease ATP-binding subunit ClpA
VFERFTEAARQVVVKAQEEARTLGHDWIGTEHLLLGLLFEQDQIAGRVLRSVGVTSERVRDLLVTSVGRGEEPSEGWIPFTPRAKKVMELGLREALSVGHNNVGTEHLLLGLLREGEGVAMRILLDLDVKPDELREAVIAMAPGPGQDPPQPRAPRRYGTASAGPGRTLPDVGVGAVRLERFTERGLQVVVEAREEARELRHSHVGSEHLLLGLLREGDGVAARVLASLGVTLERARVEVTRRVASADEPPTPGQIPFTPRARQVLERAIREALSLGHNYQGTEHILLAIASVGEGEAINALQALDVDAETIRRAVMELLSGPRATASRSIRRSGRARAAREAQTEALVPAGFRVEHGSDVVRLLMTAAARALDDGRTETALEDVLVALTRDQRTAPVLAELGLDEAAIRVALARRAQPEEPPAADAES